MLYGDKESDRTVSFFHQSFESWAHLLDARHSDEVKPLTHSAFLRSLQAFPSSSTRSRILRRSRALSALLGMDSHPTPIFGGLKALATSLSSEDPAANPFYIHPPSSAIQTNYAELGAKVELLAIGFSDLALQLYEPGAVSPTVSNGMAAETSGEGGGADASMEGVQSRPPSMVKQDSEQAVNDLLPAEAADHSAGSSGIAAAPATGHTPVPAVSNVLSSSGPTLKPNRAFRIAVQPYKSDTELLLTFGLIPSSSTSSNGGSQVESDLISAPSFGRLRDFHKILAALRGIYSRIHEGRGRLDGASATNGANGASLAGGPTDGDLNAEERQSSSSTTLDKTRCKDAIQRLILSVHYQCEVFTGFRMGGDAILEDEDDEDEQLDEANRKRALDDENDTGAGAASLEGEEAPVTATSTSAKKQRRGAGPRASDQRSLGEFFTPPAGGQAHTIPTVLKRQQTVRFGQDRDVQELEQEAAAAEAEGGEQEGGKLVGKGEEDKEEEGRTSG